MAENENLKFKAYYNLELATMLGTQLQEIYPAFALDDFVSFVGETLDTLELKDRVARMSAGMRQYLPDEYAAAVAILLQLPGDDLSDSDGMFNAGYHLMPVAHFIEVYGQDDFETSIKAIYALTKRFTSEFAIRPYLQQYPEQTLEHLRTWTGDDNQHVRRLVSEGTRTRLPWASKLEQFIVDPMPVIELLTLLRDDPAPYVRKSVANNLNDISKDHPDLVIATLRDWLQEPVESRQWIAKHALRTLLKAGNSEAMALLGFGAPAVRLNNVSLEPAEIKLGECFVLDFDVISQSDDEQLLMIDYVVHFVRAKDKTVEKVFKLKTVALPAGETVRIQKRHTIKAVTVRRYYAGEHQVDIQVNGQRLDTLSFMLDL